MQRRAFYRPYIWLDALICLRRLTRNDPRRNIQIPIWTIPTVEEFHPRVSANRPRAQVISRDACHSTSYPVKLCIPPIAAMVTGAGGQYYMVTRKAFI